MKTSWAEMLEHQAFSQENRHVGEVLQLGGAERENLRKENLKRKL